MDFSHEIQDSEILPEKNLTPGIKLVLGCPGTEVDGSMVKWVITFIYPIYK